MRFRKGLLPLLMAAYFGLFLGIAGAEKKDHKKDRGGENRQHQQRRENQNYNRRHENRQDRPQPQVEQNRRRHNDSQRNHVYKDWRGHKDFRPAHVHNRYYVVRHRHLGRIFTHNHYRTWHHRHRVFYSGYYNRNYVVYYDGLNPYWLFWLSDHPRYYHVWVYHHRFEISAERYEALLLENAELAAQIREMEERGVEVDPNYLPPGVDEDLVYSQEYIEQYLQR